VVRDSLALIKSNDDANHVLSIDMHSMTTLRCNYKPRIDPPHQILICGANQGV
jgi:hypothetical protein